MVWGRTSWGLVHRHIPSSSVGAQSSRCVRLTTGSRGQGGSLVSKSTKRLTRVAGEHLGDAGAENSPAGAGMTAVPASEDVIGCPRPLTNWPVPGRAGRTEHTPVGHSGNPSAEVPERLHPPAEQIGDHAAKIVAGDSAAFRIAAILRRVNDLAWRHRSSTTPSSWRSWLLRGARAPRVVLKATYGWYSAATS